MQGQGRSVTERKRVLVFAPHMDDEVLGCGGTIARHVECGDEVTVCICANRVYDHSYVMEYDQREKTACQRVKERLGYEFLIYLDLPDEQLDKSLIKLIVPMEKVVQELRPDIVYLPHRGDNHQDHRAVFDAVRVVCRPHARVPVRCLRVYETLSSTDQSPPFAEWQFQPNFYVDISQVLQRKLDATACYEMEGRSFPHPRSIEGITVHAKRRGMDIGIPAAEAFVTLRDGWWL